ncbi:MAG: type II toxin-antitoxin system HicB family antitoxin [Planctomycetota bacterium]
MVYRILIEKGEAFGYVAHCPAIPGCHQVLLGSFG